MTLSSVPQHKITVNNPSNHPPFIQHKNKGFTTMQSDFVTLPKKIKKVEQILNKLQLQSKSDTKEYRAYQRKLKQYEKQYKGTREYKEQALQAALNDLHESFQISRSGLDVEDEDCKTNDLSSLNDGSSTSGSSTSSGSSSSSESSSGSSSSSSSEDEKIDFPLTLRKYDKVARLMKDLEDKHGGLAKAQKRAAYQKYKIKQQEYSDLLQQCPEWPREQARRKAQAEQDRLDLQQRKAVEAAKAASKIDLERQKQEALAALREQREQREEKEKAQAIELELARKAAYEALSQESKALEKETKEREKEYQESLQEQEDRGLIKLVK